jgi:hypothetical protein
MNHSYEIQTENNYYAKNTSESRLYNKKKKEKGQYLTSRRHLFLYYLLFVFILRAAHGPGYFLHAQLLPFCLPRLSALPKPSLGARSSSLPQPRVPPWPLALVAVLLCWPAFSSVVDIPCVSDFPLLLHPWRSAVPTPSPVRPWKPRLC